MEELRWSLEAACTRGSSIGDTLEGSGISYELGGGLREGGLTYISASNSETEYVQRSYFIFLIFCSSSITASQPVRGYILV